MFTNGNTLEAFKHIAYINTHSLAVRQHSAAYLGQRGFRARCEVLPPGPLVPLVSTVLGT